MHRRPFASFPPAVTRFLFTVYRVVRLVELSQTREVNVNAIARCNLEFLKILQVSRAHVCLTYPFVLSWSMLEAMAAGCLVIGSRTAPVEEVIRDGENGLLVDFFSPAKIAERMIAVLEDPEAYARMRDQARQTIVENYDLKSVCLPRQLELLEELRDRR